MRTLPESTLPYSIFPCHDREDLEQRNTTGYEYKISANLDLPFTFTDRQTDKRAERQAGRQTCREGRENEIERGIRRNRKKERERERGREFRKIYLQFNVL